MVNILKRSEGPNFFPEYGQEAEKTYAPVKASMLPTGGALTRHLFSRCVQRCTGPPGTTGLAVQRVAKEPVELLTSSSFH
jgi:hypothetical protein